ncbi:MAG: helix-turn-helix transcriptional regulator [Myxococcales bacterium]|nr:helix-turn-helix transcriptional regulator [Myxococcales bacterium]
MGFRPCRLVLLADERPLAAAWLGCQPRRRPCSPDAPARALEPLLAALAERADLLSSQIPAGFIAQLIRLLDCAAFIVRSDQQPLLCNEAAGRLARLPTWMKDGWVEDGAWARLPLTGNGSRYFLMLSRNGSTPLAAAAHSDWAARFDFSPHLARTAALLLRGLSDKEIASLLGLSHHTVRTYVKEILSRSNTHSRHGFVARALGAL